MDDITVDPIEEEPNGPPTSRLDDQETEPMVDPLEEEPNGPSTSTLDNQGTEPTEE